MQNSLIIRHKICMQEHNILMWERLIIINEIFKQEYLIKPHELCVQDYLIILHIIFLLALEHLIIPYEIFLQ